MAVLDGFVAIHRIPEIREQLEIDRWKREQGKEVFPDLAPVPCSTIDGGLEHPIHEAKKRMIQLVLSDSDEIDVVRQARNERVARRIRGKLDDGDSVLEQRIAHN